MPSSSSSSSSASSLSSPASKKGVEEEENVEGGIAAMTEALAMVQEIGVGSRAEALVAALTGPMPLSYSFLDFQKARGAVLRTSDFSWELHGHALLSRFVPAIAPALDREMDTVYRLTYNTFGGASDVDTEPLRQAVWYYVLHLHGIFHTDFKYNVINEVLRNMRPLKAFCRKVACFPRAIRSADFHACSHTLTPAEKTHVVLLCVQSRKLASLLYALRAVTAHYQKHA
jgi:hypothetical protein